MGAAQRRRERRLRSWYRHEQQTARMALATFTHHSALRGQKMARAGEEDNEVPFTATIRANPPPQAAGTENFALDEDVPAAGSRPDRLSAVSGPQERVLRHAVEQMADSTPVVPMLEAPVQQLGCSVVGSVLGRWEPLPPHARVRPVLNQAAGHRRDQARLVEACR